MLLHFFKAVYSCKASYQTNEYIEYTTSAYSAVLEVLAPGLSDIVVSNKVADHWQLEAYDSTAANIYRLPFLANLLPAYAHRNADSGAIFAHRGGTDTNLCILCIVPVSWVSFLISHFFGQLEF